MEKIKNKTVNPAVIMIVFCVLIYATSYVGRKAYDSNINEIMAFYGQEKSVVGLAGTMFFVAYAIGQVVHGLMCKYYNPKIAVAVALFVASLVNFGIAVMPVEGFRYIKYLWLISGFAHATFWSVLVLITTKYIASKYTPKAIIALAFPVSIGTFVSYGLSALMSYLNNFKMTFYVSASLLFVLAIVWALSSNALFKACELQRRQLDGDELKETQKDVNKKQSKKGSTPKSFIVLFSALAMVAVINNLVKDGINTWTPTLLKEKYNLENWLSVFLTLFIPLFAVCGSYLAIALNKKFKNYCLTCGVLYSVATVTFFILILCINLSTWVVTLFSFILVVLLMSGINCTVTSVFPMENGDKANPGTVAGLIDGFCYVGSAIASFGLGKIVEIYSSWNVVMYLLLGLCVFATVVCFASMLIQKKQKPVKD